MEHDGSTPTFTLDLDVQDELKPLPYVLKKPKAARKKTFFLPTRYPQYDPDFFRHVDDCARKISELKSPDHKTKYNHDLSRIFANRDKAGSLRLFMELTRIHLGELDANRTTTSH